jgi:hypothetical protein
VWSRDSYRGEYLCLMLNRTLLARAGNPSMAGVFFRENAGGLQIRIVFQKRSGKWIGDFRLGDIDDGAYLFIRTLLVREDVAHAEISPTCFRNFAGGVSVILDMPRDVQRALDQNRSHR